MVKEVVWTAKALETFNNVIIYLNAEWSLKEIFSFTNATDRVIDQIIEFPEMFRKVSGRNTYEALITPHNLLIYRIKRNQIELLLFWDTRQNPKRKKF